jgi:hypothetical protein
MPITVGTEQKVERPLWATITIIVVTWVSWWYSSLGYDPGFIPVPLPQRGSLFHIFLNMFYFLVFGSYLESRIGWVTFSPKIGSFKRGRSEKCLCPSGC